MAPPQAVCYVGRVSPQYVGNISLVEVTDDAVNMVSQFEGFRSEPYQDSAGVWTIGYGSTRDADGSPIDEDTDSVTKQQALDLMRRDLLKTATILDKDVHVALNDHERAALESFIYNVGAGNFEASTLLKKLNAGDIEGSANEFLRWDHAGGKVLAGLLKRREAERSEFMKG